jgi:Flp pilus assembly protein TadG
MALQLRSRQLASERGAEVIEFAIVLPVLLLVVFGIIDFGFLFQRYVVVTNAAVEGARVASLPGYGDADAQDRALEYAREGGIPGLAATGTPCRATAGDPNQICVYVADVPLPGSTPSTTWPGKQVTVTYIYNYSYIGPIASMFGSSFNSVTLNARSTMRRQCSGPGC